MRILLTNDDGIFAPGLAAIYKELTAFGQVIVVAPTESRSGSSHSVTFHMPVTCTKVEINGLFTGYGVAGSPADCVKLACMQLHTGPIDLVVAGINNGANVGINVFYSGTVAAAMEAALLKIPSVALSLAIEQEMDFARAATHCAALLRRLLPLETGRVININIPPLSTGGPKGVRVVPQSMSGFHEYYIPKNNADNEILFQLAGGLTRDEAECTDTVALTQGFITVTPLVADMTDHARIARLESILSQSQGKSG